MARTLSQLPLGTPIVDTTGAINVFFRQVWETLRNSFGTVGTANTPLQKLNQNAALGTTKIHTTLAAGLYRLSYYVRKTAADGVSSSLTVTVSWVESGVTLTDSAAAIATDATTAQQSGTKLVWADAATDLTVAVAYSSNTPGNMKYRLDACAELLI
jgi:hypothetical protein